MKEHAAIPLDSGAAVVSEVDLPDPAATVGWSEPRWSRDGTHIVVERLVDGRAWPWLDEHRADVGPALVLVGLAIGVWWLVRTWRRPRQAGRRYCRRCNHDVGGAEALPERCGECGGTLAGRGMVVGRGRWRRLGPMLALAAFLVAGGGLLAHGAIVGSSTQIFGPRTAWPFAALDHFPNWPFVRAHIPLSWAKRLDVVAVEADGRLRIVPTSVIEPPTNALWCVSDDGRMLAWSRFDPSNGWRQEVCWFDVDANVERSTFVGSNSDGFVRVCGFGPDGRSIVVRRDRLVGAPAEQIVAPDGATIGRHAVDVLVVDPRDGTTATVATAEALALAAGQQSWQIEPGLVVLGAGPRVTWASFTLSRQRPPAQSPYAARITSLTIGNGSETRVLEVQGDPVAITGEVMATIVDDRELVVEGIDATVRGTGTARMRYRIDLATGAAISELVEPPSAFAAAIDASAGINNFRSIHDPEPAFVRLVVRRRGPTRRGSSRRKRVSGTRRERGTSPLGTLVYEAQGHDENRGANGSCDKFAHQIGRLQSHEVEDEAAKNGADDTDDQIPKHAGAAAPDHLSCEESGDETDQEKPDDVHATS